MLPLVQGAAATAQRAACPGTLRAPGRGAPPTDASPRSRHQVCLEFPAVPLPFCCCGPTCACNHTLIKGHGKCFCLVTQVSIPCTSDTPIVFAPLPFLVLYPKVGCCETLDSIKKKEKEEKKGEPATEAPKADEMVRS